MVDEDLFIRIPALAGLRPMLAIVTARLVQTIRGGGTIFVCGNGGSAADAEHIVGELMKSFLLPRPVPNELRRQLVAAHGQHGEALADGLQQGIRTISLAGSAALATAYGNDVDWGMVFAQQLYALARPGDALLAISTSGKATNVIHAAEVAGVLGLLRIGLTGTPGGKLPGVTDFCLCVPASEAYLVQELQVPLYHALCANLEQEIYGRG